MRDFARRENALAPAELYAMVRVFLSLIHTLMKSTLIRLLTAGLCAAALFASTSRASVEVGQAAPDFTLTDIAGKSHKLSEFKGKTVVLEWTNPECPFVKKHYDSGNMPKTQKAAEADGVVWLTINSGHAGAEGDYDNAASAAWLKKNGATPTAYFRDLDGKVGRLYSAKTSPHMFVISKDGTLVYDGAIDSKRTADQADIAAATNYVDAALASIKAGKPVEKANTQPYGCAVKY